MKIWSSPQTEPIKTLNSLFREKEGMSVGYVCFLKITGKSSIFRTIYVSKNGDFKYFRKKTQYTRCFKMSDGFNFLIN